MKDFVNKIGKLYLAVVLLWAVSVAASGQVTPFTAVTGLLVVSYLIYKYKVKK